MKASRETARCCLLGGALGDCLGSEIEFMPFSKIIRIHGSEGVRELPLRDGKACITDDTQMTLFTAVGLANGDVWGALLDWFDTQYPKNRKPLGKHKTWLFDIPEMHRSEAPGITCLNALDGGVQGSVLSPVNNSKGCGGVMRVAPAGLITDSVEEAMFVGAELAAMTHGHPFGWLSGAAFSGMVRACADGMSILQSLELIVTLLPKLWPDVPYAAHMAGILRAAESTAWMPIPDHEAVSVLGEGWVGEEALAIAVCSALRYPDDMKGCLRMAANHSGDSDSTAAIAGNLLGATLTMDKMPQDWVDLLEIKDIIIRAADECC